MIIHRAVSSLLFSASFVKEKGGFQPLETTPPPTKKNPENKTKQNKPPKQLTSNQFQIHNSIRIDFFLIVSSQLDIFCNCYFS